MQHRVSSRVARLACIASGVAALALLPGCSKKASDDESADAPAANTAAAPTATATPAAAAAPSADSTDTLAGVKYADYHGDAAAGEKVFVQCKTCHVADPGVNRIGPSLHAVVGRHAGIIPNFHYSDANKNSGITWSEAKLFQYLEKPQRVVPGTYMTFPGLSDPQQRADVIAYLKTQS